VRHHHLSTGALDRIRDPPGALGIDGQRLLDHHVDTGIQRAGDQVGVRVVGRGDDRPVGPGFGYQPLEVVGATGGHRADVEPGVAQPAAMHAQPSGVGLDERNQLPVLAMLAGHGVEVHLHAVTGSDHHVASSNCQDLCLST